MSSSIPNILRSSLHASSHYRLVSLDVVTDETVWSVVFQLTALTQLSIAFDVEADSSQAEVHLPEERCLPKLVSLILDVNNDSGVGWAPLLEGADLPFLNNLLISGGNRQCSSLSSIGALSSLRQLKILNHSLTEVRSALVHVIMYIFARDHIGVSM